MAIPCTTSASASASGSDLTTASTSAAKAAVEGALGGGGPAPRMIVEGDLAAPDHGPSSAERKVVKQAQLEALTSTLPKP